MNKPTVLVVDDDSISIEIVGHALKDIAEIVFATSGEEALGLMQTERPDLVLLDVMMPGIDGFEVCEAIKADRRFRDVPVVFISAATDEAEEARGLLAGAVEYVTKPIRPTLLAARVRNLLELRHRRAEREIDEMLDDVTGLGGRRQLERTMLGEWRQAARSGQPLSLALVAFDDFAAFEAVFGSAAAEDSLRRIGQALTEAVRRPGDAVTRFSADRFAVLLPGTDHAGVAIAAEGLRRAVEGLGLPGPHNADSPATISVGIATAHPAAAPSPADLITHARERLEEALRLGGNRSAGAPALPWQRSATPAVGANAVRFGQAGRRTSDCHGRLFIVDDDPISIEVLSELATRGGYDIEFARDAVEAVALIVAGQPDVVLLDVEMPGENGFEVCRRLKANPTTAHIPVVFLSALTDSADKVRAFEVGGADYVAKPFQPEEVLARVAHQLKITRLQAEMRKVNDRLLELDRLKATFAAMLVHDLRSPLTVVHTTLSLLQEHRFDDAPDVGEMVGFSTESLDKSLALIAEVLEIYRSDADGTAPNLVEGDVAAVLSRCALAAQIEGRRRGVVVDARFAAPLYARLDERRFERACTNLLSNAIKFTRAGGKVTLEGRRIGHPLDPRIRIDVVDTGQGIPEAELPHVFELYRQVSSSHRTAGVGLGLAIVKRIVDAHEGTISVRSQIGVGTAFTIELRASAPPARTTTLKSAQAVDDGPGPTASRMS